MKVTLRKQPYHFTLKSDLQTDEVLIVHFMGKVTRVFSMNCIIRGLCKLRQRANESTSVKQTTFPTWGGATYYSLAINTIMFSVTLRYNHI